VCEDGSGGGGGEREGRGYLGEGYVRRDIEM
jgi:hypothetical protein